MFATKKVRKVGSSVATDRKRRKRRVQLERLEQRHLLAVEVLLDFADFDARLDDLTTSISATQFTPAEKSAIRVDIDTALEDAYSDFDVNFVPVGPAPGATIRFGQTDPNGFLGIASQDFPDFMNHVAGTTVDVFTANFTFANQVTQFATDPVGTVAQLLTYTAAHELGHSFGLLHQDSFGTPEAPVAQLNGAGEALTNVNGAQNNYFLATGSTGQTADGRVETRRFSPFSLAKLEFADDLTPTPVASTQETTLWNDDSFNAQGIGFTDLPISGLQGVNVVGSIDVGDGADFYRFNATEGDLLSVNVVNEMLNPANEASPFDSTVELWNFSNQTLVTGNDTHTSTTTVGAASPGSLQVSQDALIMNFEIPSTGIYYLKVDSETGATGDYNLFSTIANPFHNYDSIGDTNRDGDTTPLDALIIINAIAVHAPVTGSFVPTPASAGSDALDVTNDRLVSPLDALRVINLIAVAQSGGSAEGEQTTPSTLLGEVDYEFLDNEAVSNSMYYEFTVANDGELSVEALFSDAAGDIDLRVYRGTNPQLEGESDSWTNDFERVDFSVTAGDHIIVEVAGSNPQVDLRINNMVRFFGSSIDITGTDGNDTLNVDATTSGTYSFTVNGTSYDHVSSSATIDFAAGNGDDVAYLYTSSGYDKAYLYESSYNIDGYNYNLDGSGVETKYVYSNGGNDRAYLYDSASNDQFRGYTSYATMSGPGFYNYVSSFYRVYSFATNGGYDYAFLYDSSGNDTYVSWDNYSTLSGTGFYNYASGFEGTYAFASSGNDTAVIYDSSGDDYYYTSGSYGYVSGPGKIRYQSRFDTVNLYGYNGGTNSLNLNAIDHVLNHYGSWTLV